MFEQNLENYSLLIWYQLLNVPKFLHFFQLFFCRGRMVTGENLVPKQTNKVQETNARLIGSRRSEWQPKQWLPQKGVKLNAQLSFRWQVVQSTRRSVMSIRETFLKSTFSQMFLFFANISKFSLLRKNIRRKSKDWFE